MNKIKGKVWKFGDSISTTEIYPGRYLELFDPKEIGKHAMEGINPDFTKKVQKNDIILAGKNFGCGSSREQAIISIKEVGISVIIAKSFARIFYRNAINQGIPPIICEQIISKTNEGDVLEIDFENSIIHNVSNDAKAEFQKLPKFIMDIINDGGLVPHVQKKIELVK